MFTEYCNSETGTKLKNYNRLFPLEEIDAHILAKLKPLNGGEVDVLVRDAITAQDHSLIIGEGGMGKTTALFHLAKEATGGTFFYFALNSLNGVGLKGSSLEDIIFDGFQKHYTREHGLSMRENDRRRLREDFDEMLLGDHKLYFLLDGLNEVSDAVIDDLERSINDLSKRPAACVVLTSRRILGLNRFNNHAIYQQQPLEDDVIKNYLRKNNRKRIHHPGLLAVLKNPMMLTVYCRMKDWQKGWEAQTHYISNPTKKGQILRNYFLWISAKAHLDELVDPKDAEFIVWVCVPYIAQYMCAHDIFDNLSQNEFEKLIGEVIKHEKMPYTCEQVISMMEKMNVLERRIQETPNQDKQYKFSHQHFRDFMAATYYHRHMGRRDVDLKKVFTQILSDDILRFIGEICREEAPVYQDPAWRRGCENTLVEHCLDRMRGEFDDKARRVVKNLITISILCRSGDLTGMNLSRLDLLDVRLNGYYFDNNISYTEYSSHEIRCSRNVVRLPNPLKTNFSGALLSGDTLLPLGHNTAINRFLVISGAADGDRMFTFGGDSVICHQLATGVTKKFIYALKNSTVMHIHNVCDMGCGQIVTTDQNNNVVLWKYDEQFDLKIIDATRTENRILSLGLVRYGDGAVFACGNGDLQLCTIQNDCRMSVDRIGNIFEMLQTERDDLRYCALRTFWSHKDFEDDELFFSYRTCIYLANRKGVLRVVDLSEYADVIHGIYATEEVKKCTIRSFHYFPQMNCYIVSVIGHRYANYLLAVPDRGRGRGATVIAFKNILPIKHEENPKDVSRQLASNEHGDNQFYWITDFDDIGAKFLVSANDGCFYECYFSRNRWSLPTAFPGHDENINNVRQVEYIKYQNVENDTAIVSVGNDRSMKIRGTGGSPFIIHDFRGFYSGLRTFRYCKEQDLFVAAMYEHKISVWKPDRQRRLQCLCSLSVHRDWVWSADIHWYEDSGLLYAVSGSQDCTIRITNLLTGKILKVVQNSLEGKQELDYIYGHTARVQSVVFSRDGGKILSAGLDGRVLVHEILDMDEEICRCFSTVVDSRESSNGKSNGARSAIFGEDCRTVIVGWSDDTRFGPDGKELPGGTKIQEYRQDTEDRWIPIARYRAGEGWTRSLCLNRAGDLFLSSGEKSEKSYHTLLWKRGVEKAPIARFGGHTEYVLWSVFSPDDRFVLSASDDKSVQIYELPDTCSGDRRPIIKLEHADKVFYIEFSEDSESDGNYFYVTSLDGTIYQWNFNGLMALYREHAQKVPSEMLRVLLTETNESVLRRTQNMSGFLFHGANFRGLHEQSEVSAELQRYMRVFGCEVDYDQFSRQRYKACQY